MCFNGDDLGVPKKSPPGPIGTSGGDAKTSSTSKIAMSHVLLNVVGMVAPEGIEEAPSSPTKSLLNTKRFFIVGTRECCFHIPNGIMLLKKHRCMILLFHDDLLIPVVLV